MRRVVTTIEVTRYEPHPDGTGDFIPVPVTVDVAGWVYPGGLEHGVDSGAFKLTEDEEAQAWQELYETAADSYEAREYDSGQVRDE